DKLVTGVQTCALPISGADLSAWRRRVPATEESQHDQSAGRGESSRWARGRTGRAVVDARRRRAPRHVDGTRRQREDATVAPGGRSEERRVGKEGRWGG